MSKADKKNKKKLRGSMREYFRLARSSLLSAAGMLMGIVLAVILFIWMITSRGPRRLILNILEALGIYRFAMDVYDTFRRYADLILIACVGIAFIVFVALVARSFVRYIRQINSGIDRILLEEEEDIRLPPELAASEERLNTLRRTLAQRQRAAAYAEQRKNELVVYLAHDIKTPLTSVIGYLSLLDEAHDMPGEQRMKYVRVSLEKAYRLENLISDFFEITRYNLQTIVLHKEDIDLYYMLAQMAEEFYPILSPQGKTIDIHVGENIRINGDPNHLARVFNNILRNAASYSDSDSAIRIGAREEPDKIILTFTNTGKEIPSDSLETIFDKFYRLDDARSSDTGGAGLGLAIAREIVEQHGGGISASSSGGVTAFTVILPK